MSRPHVLTHVLMSVDARLDGFPPDVGRYYELAARLPHDAVLTGSGTMLAAARDAGTDLAEEDDPADGAVKLTGPELPLLVVVDSRGRLTRFAWLRATGFFDRILVLGSQTTPASHRARLRSLGVEFEVVGPDRVDLTVALGVLHERHHVETLRVDAGPGLNGMLLAAGLVDEISVLFSPHLVGDGRAVLASIGARSPQRLRVLDVETVAGDHVWLRYAVPPS